MPLPDQRRLRFERAGLLAGLSACAALLLALVIPQSSLAAEPLPALAARADQTSVSGISSGAYMAGQVQLAHSESIVGAAIIAGGPWGCAESLFADVMPGMSMAFINAQRAVSGCMLNAMALWGVPNPRLLADKAQRLSEKGAIGPLDAVRSDRIYIFSGAEDRLVMPSIVAAARSFYALLGVPDAQIAYKNDTPAGHGFVTSDAGDTCGRTGTPYVVDCDYDSAGALLTHIYGPLLPPAAGDKLAGQISTFDQRVYTAGFASHGLSGEGVVYVPGSCAREAGCRVHVAFHGCAQSRALVGDAFIRQTGFLRWAESNRLIVLFPQVAASAVNPQACWDWWGYSDRNFLTQSAPQIVAVKRMLDRLSAAR